MPNPEQFPGEDGGESQLPTEKKTVDNMGKLPEEQSVTEDEEEKKETSLRIEMRRPENSLGWLSSFFKGRERKKFENEVQGRILNFMRSTTPENRKELIKKVEEIVTVVTEDRKQPHLDKFIFTALKDLLANELLARREELESKHK